MHGIDFITLCARSFEIMIYYTRYGNTNYTNLTNSDYLFYKCSIDKDQKMTKTSGL